MIRSSQYGQCTNPMRQASSNTFKKQRVPNSERRRISIEAVLDAALQLFVTQGYGATSMDDIAGNAGLTKGAVYFYFKDKLSLASELLARTENELFDPMYKLMQQSNGTAADRIVIFANWLAKMGETRIELPLLHVLMSMEFHGRGNAVESRLRDTYKRLRNEIEKITREGQESGEFTDIVPPREQAAVIVALIDGLLMEWHRGKDKLDGEVLARSARAMILNGIVDHGTET